MQLRACVPFLVLGLTLAWNNNWNRPLRRLCPAGQTIYRIRSKHSDHYEDRRYQFKCKEIGVSPSRCYWTQFVNNWGALINFNCKRDYVITGISSYQGNLYGDRRFKFRCCALVCGRQGDCRLTPIINEWTECMDYTAPAGYVIRGFKSWHHHYHKDRRWQVYICRETK